MALYFAVGLSGFAGSEPGWLSQNLNHFWTQIVWKIFVKSWEENPIHKLWVTKMNFYYSHLVKCKIDQQVKHLLFHVILSLHWWFKKKVSMWWFLLSLKPIYFYYEREEKDEKRWVSWSSHIFKKWSKTFSFLKSFACYSITHYVGRSVHLLVCPLVGWSIH